MDEGDQVIHIDWVYDPELVNDPRFLAEDLCATLSIERGHDRIVVPDTIVEEWLRLLVRGYQFVYEGRGVQMQLANEPGWLALTAGVEGYSVSYGEQTVRFDDSMELREALVSACRRFVGWESSLPEHARGGLEEIRSFLARKEGPS